MKNFLQKFTTIEVRDNPAILGRDVYVKMFGFKFHHHEPELHLFEYLEPWWLTIAAWIHNIKIER